VAQKVQHGASHELEVIEAEDDTAKDQAGLQEEQLIDLFAF
jgi:hypothetical protein